MSDDPAAAGLGILGGGLAPLGTGMAFLRASMATVLDAVRDVRSESLIDVTAAGKLPGSAALLDPMEMPWTVELLADCGDWTAYMNNAIGGTDISAIAPALGRRLEVTCVTAQHAPKHGPGHAATQLWLQGPGGAPPLMGIRDISAHCQDGRWSWHTFGEVQSFERPEMYDVRKIRDRFNRPLLIEYLEALGIHADDPSFFGDCVAVRQLVDWPRRTVSVAAWRSDN